MPMDANLSSLLFELTAACVYLVFMGRQSEYLNFPTVSKKGHLVSRPEQCAEEKPRARVGKPRAPAPVRGADDITFQRPTPRGSTKADGGGAAAVLMEDPSHRHATGRTSDTSCIQQHHETWRGKPQMTQYLQ